MPCEQCGGELSLEDEQGGTISGSFVEKYECPYCDARGEISGEASDSPRSWDKNGRAFNDY